MAFGLGKKPASLEELQRLFDGLSDEEKEAFKRSISGGEEESPAVEEPEEEHEEDGEEVEEAEETEETPVPEEPATEPAAEEAHPDAQADGAQIEQYLQPLLKRLQALEAQMTELKHTPAPAGKTEADRLSELERKFG